MPEPSGSVQERVWRAMFEFLLRSAPRRTEALARRGLTPNDSRALFSLDHEHGRSMRSLADAWECDPSNATWIVDRLEKLGLAERRAAPHDRRVKLVALTRKGLRARSALMLEFHRPPDELAALSVEDLETLERLLSKLPAPERREPPSRTRARRSSTKRR
ncbi:MAG TPA: MarR family transcriptional regulator [Vicinamibacterales bacterium]|nr:MarR family transcriptional regulator [Vicinamibacterales bacterium]